MIQLLKYLFESIGNIITFLINGILGIFELLYHLPAYITAISLIIGEVPALYSSFILVSITISIVFLIIGRSK